MNQPLRDEDYHPDFLTNLFYNLAEVVMKWTTKNGQHEMTKVIETLGILREGKGPMLDDAVKSATQLIVIYEGSFYSSESLSVPKKLTQWDRDELKDIAMEAVSSIPFAIETIKDALPAGLGEALDNIIELQAQALQATYGETVNRDRIIELLAKVKELS